MGELEKTSTSPLDQRSQPVPVSSAPHPVVRRSVSEFDDSIDAPDELVPHLHAKTFLALLAVCLIYFAQVVSVVGAGVQAQTIGSHFHDTSKVVWFPGAIGIFTVILGPIVSQAADYWNRKWFLIIPNLFGAVGSAVVARATSINMVIAGFCITGIAFGTQPLLHVVTSEILPRRWRGWAQASNLVFVTLGGVLGLYVGGALNRSNDPAADGFRYYFYMVMACFITASVVCTIVYNPPPIPTQTQHTPTQKLAKLDWIGYLLLSTGLVFFMVGLSYSRNPYQWSDPEVFATFTVGVIFSLALVVYETFFKTDGLFHHGLFSRNRNFSIAMVCIFCEGLAFSAVNIYFTFHVTVLYEKDAFLVAVRYSFKYTIAALFACLTGWYCMATRRFRWLTVAAFCIFCAFFVCMATSGRESDHQVWGYTILLGMAFGITLTTLVTVAQISTPPELISIASGLIISIRSLGSTISLAIYNAVFNEAMGHLDHNVAEAVAGQGLAQESVETFIAGLVVHNDTALQAIPDITPEILESGISAFLDTYVVAFRNVWLSAVCFIVLAGISAVFLIDEQEQFNMHIDNPIEKKEELYSA